MSETDLIIRNYEFISHNSDIITHNCEFYLESKSEQQDIFFLRIYWIVKNINI